MGQTEALYTSSAADLNVFITVAALADGFAQLVFIFNVFWSAKNGEVAEKNPWKSTSLEWQTPEQPPILGNFGKELPVVYRWAYDYGVPGAEDDFIPQDVPNEKVKLADGYTELGVEKT